MCDMGKDNILRGMASRDVYGRVTCMVVGEVCLVNSPLLFSGPIRTAMICSCCLFLCLFSPIDLYITNENVLNMILMKYLVNLYLMRVCAHPVIQ
jgi:hypothetical protein